MAVITFPTTLARKISRRQYDLDFPAQENRSSWSGTSRIVLLSGIERHEFRIAFRPLNTETAIREARAFFAALHGIANTFDLPYLPRPQSGTNTTVASGGTAGSKTVNVVSGASILPGMPFHVVMPSGHRRLVILTSKVTNALTFAPGLTENAAVGASVEVLNPVSRVRLADPRFSYTDEMGLAGFAVDLKEAT